MAPKRALLLVGHGTIADPRDVPEFLARIRRGRPASPALVMEIERRYREIGRSPLLDVTQSLGRALAERLGFRAYVAMRFWAPLVGEVLKELLTASFEEVVVLPLAPFSVHVYVGVVEAALRGLDVRADESPALVPVSPYGGEANLIELHAAKIAAVLDGKPELDTELVLTAHSLPTRVIAGGDPYQQQFEDAARKILEAVGRNGRIAYQSQGEGGDEWLGPTLAEVIEDAARGGKQHLVVAPVGFVADHVETLYDLDVEAAAHASRLGIGFSRVPALGDDPAFVTALAMIIERTLGDDE